MSYRFMVIGAGEGGCRIADKFIEKRYCARAVAVNTSRPDLEGLRNIPIENKLLLRTPMRLAGAGKNPDIGEKAARDPKNAEEIFQFLDYHCFARWEKDDARRRDLSCDYIIITVGGGGGTGTGLAVPLAEIAEQLGKPVGMIYTLPARNEGTVTLINALELLKPLHSMAAEGKLSPFILADNEKLTAECGLSRITDYWGAVNFRICQPLHVINICSDQTSRFVSALDTADLGTLLLAGGCCSLNAFTFKDFGDEEAAVSLLGQGYHMTGFDLSSAKVAGLIVSGTERTLDKPEVVRVYNRLNEEVAACLGGGLIYRGLYENDKIGDGIKVVAVFNGMTLPEAKLDEMFKEMERGIANMESKDRRVQGFHFSVENKRSLKGPGMDRLRKLSREE